MDNRSGGGYPILQVDMDNSSGGGYPILQVGMEAAAAEDILNYS